MSRCSRAAHPWAALVVVVAVLGWLAATASVALAHAELDRADPPPGSTVPQAPASLRLHFSEQPDGSFSRVQVLNAQRQEVDTGDSHIAADDPLSIVVSLPVGLPDGVYTVAWRTLSAVDGHEVSGAYPLVFGSAPVGTPVTAASTESGFAPETAVARWWFYVSAATLLGSLVAWLFVISPLGPSVRAAGGVPSRRARRVALVAGVSLVLATLYGAVAQAASAADVSMLQVFGQPLVDLLTRGRYPLIWWPRLGLAVLAVIVMAVARMNRRAVWLAVVAAAGALLTNSFTSHGAALASGAYLATAIDWIHLTATSTWIGGLVSLIFVLPAARAAAGTQEQRVFARAIRRFTFLALPAVVVIAATGTFQAWLEVGSFDALGGTDYGRDLLVKVALFLVMVSLGAVNFLVLERSLLKLAGKASPAFGRAGRYLTWTVRAEVAIALVVLGVTAVLTGLAPARQDYAQQQSGEAAGGPVDKKIDLGSGVTAEMIITPAAVGQNTFTVNLPDVDPSTVDRVQLNLTYLDSDLGTQPLELIHSPDANTSWTAQATALSQPGSWQSELLLRRRGLDDLRSALRFSVSGTGAPQQTSSANAAYPLLPSPPISAAYALGALGIGITLLGLARPGRRAWRDRGAMAAAGLLAVGCGGYVYAQEQRNGVPLDVVNVRNPISPDATSIASGKAVYDQYCAVCHGDTGRGDGPGGLRLVPRPADLRVHMAAGHTDGQLFYWVSYGFPGTAMPAWKDRLSEEQRWDVINYIRTFADSNPLAPPPPSTVPNIVPSPSSSATPY